jgi:hypothetical protein
MVGPALRLPEVGLGDFAQVFGEEDLSVFAGLGIVVVLGRELQREAAEVAHLVCGAQPADRGAQAREDLGLLADLGQERRSGVRSDVGGRGEVL